MTAYTKEHRDQLIAEAKAIAEKAQTENRDLTGAEYKSIQDRLGEAKDINEAMVASAKSRDIFGQLDAMASNQNRDGSEQFLRFSKDWAGGAAEKVMPFGQKALATGQPVFLDVELQTTPIPIGRPATSLLDVLPAQRHQQPAFSYFRQSVRTNNAAVVADGATKPTSVYTLVKIDNTLSVVAHLSEAVPRYWFEDTASLKPFMQEELAYGLRLAVESKVLADINGTSGIQTQAFATSALVTLRKSLTKLEAFGHEPAAIVIDPVDWEAVELSLSTVNAVEHMSLPYDAAARRLYGVPVVVANIEAAGTAHVIAKGAIGVDTDSLGVAIQWSETSNADDFAKNLVRARCEGRFATSVFQPLGVVVADLTE